MAKIKLTKSAVDAAQPQDKAIELRDTVVPGFLCKITPAGRKVFMLQYRTNCGERRKPAIGRFGDLTVVQALQYGVGLRLSRDKDMTGVYGADRVDVARLRQRLVSSDSSW